MPFAALMPHVSAMISNGGYGGLHFALAHGVPLVVAGASEDKPELVARVNWTSVGVGLRTQRPRPERLRAAVRRVLSDPTYGGRATALKHEMAAYGGPRDGRRPRGSPRRHPRAARAERLRAARRQPRSRVE